MFKKYFFLLLLGYFFVETAYSQTFEILGKDSTELPDTVVVMTDTSKSTLQDFYFRIKNNMPRETRVGLARRLVRGPITFTSACFGDNCYNFNASDTVDTLNANITIEANAIYDEFHASVAWEDDSVTICYFDYIFFNVDNSSDSVVVPVKIVVAAEPSYVKTVTQVQLISRPYPVPADNILNFDYHINQSGELVFYNILGVEQKRIRLDQSLSHVAVSVSDLKSGVYFYSLYVGNEKKTTNRMMIRH